MSGGQDQPPPAEAWDSPNATGPTDLRKAVPRQAGGGLSEVEDALFAQKYCNHEKISPEDSLVGSSSYIYIICK